MSVRVARNEFWVTMRALRPESYVGLGKQPAEKFKKWAPYFSDARKLIAKSSIPCTLRIAVQRSNLVQRVAGDLAVAQIGLEQTNLMTEVYSKTLDKWMADWNLQYDWIQPFAARTLLHWFENPEAASRRDPHVVAGYEHPLTGAWLAYPAVDIQSSEVYEGAMPPPQSVFSHRASSPDHLASLRYDESLGVWPLVLDGLYRSPANVLGCLTSGESAPTSKSEARRTFDEDADFWVMQAEPEMASWLPVGFSDIVALVKRTVPETRGSRYAESLRAVGGKSDIARTSREMKKLSEYVGVSTLNAISGPAKGTKHNSSL